MRKIKAVSPTSLHLWETDREAFFKKYLADIKPTPIPQTEAMAVGSAFDAYVKAWMYEKLFGNNGDGEYSLVHLLETQVDKDVLPFATEAGLHCFDCYWKSGLAQDLLKDMEGSREDPRFEFTLTGTIGGIPLIGKPDMWYFKGCDVVLDWKVMGYCSKHAQSPKKFYKTCRDTWSETEAKPTRGFKDGVVKAHKAYEEMEYCGHKIGSHWLEDTDKRWADQISIYSWMLGLDVGEENVVTCIDQLACKPSDGRPLIRVAQHRCRISAFWQHSLMGRLQDMWDTLGSGHIFDDLSREDSDAQCEVMNMPQPEETDDLWAMVNERQYRG